MTMPFEVRRVVTGHDGRGLPVVVSDGTPPATAGSRSGHAVSEVWWFDEPPRGIDDGGEPTGRPGVFPVDGAIAARVIRFPAVPADTPDDQRWLRVPGDDPAAPGMHRTDTLDLMVVLSGRVVLGLDDGEREIGPGDTVVQRGTAHRWRVVGGQPCVCLCVLASPVPGAKATESGVAETAAGAQGPRRVVTSDSDAGTSTAVCDGPPAVGLSLPGSPALYDLWQTGGPLAHPGQGGDREGPWALGPDRAGVGFVHVIFPPGRTPHPGDVHTTPTVDIGVVVEGSLELALPGEAGIDDGVTVVLAPGDVVVQRGTAHRWRALGEAPARLVSVMIGAG